MKGKMYTILYIVREVTILVLEAAQYYLVALFDWIHRLAEWPGRRRR